MMKIYIGIDVGTTSLKALALTEKGECVATAKSSYELYASGAEATQNANDWYEAAVSAIREIAEKVKDLGEICAISVSAQGGATVLLDGSGKTLTPGKVALDEEEHIGYLRKCGILPLHPWVHQPKADGQDRRRPHLCRDSTSI